MQADIEAAMKQAPILITLFCASYEIHQHEKRIRIDDASLGFLPYCRMFGILVASHYRIS